MVKIEGSIELDTTLFFLSSNNFQGRISFVHPTGVNSVVYLNGGPTGYLKK
jgi:hypothetical protein